MLDEWGRETVLLFFLTAHWRSPIDFSEETMAAAQAQWRSFQQAIYENRDPAPAVGWEAFEAALDDDFNTAQALAVLHEWRAASQLELLQRGLDGLRARLRPGTASGGGERARRRARGRARCEGLRGLGRAARSDCRARVGRSGHARGLGSRPEVTRELVYGRRPVREAIRGPREVLEVWATERALNCRAVAA